MSGAPPAGDAGRAPAAPVERLPAYLRAFYAKAELAEFWTRARRHVEGRRAGIDPDGRPSKVGVSVTAETRGVVQQLPGAERGRDERPAQVRVDLTALARKLRDEHGVDLADLIAEHTGGAPLVHRPAQKRVRRERAARVRERFLGELERTDLAGAAWTSEWLDWLTRGLTEETAAERVRLARHACDVLARIHLDPDRPAESVLGLAELAHAEARGGSHGLEERRAPLATLVLRAAAFAHGRSWSDRAEDVRTLWERCGVSTGSPTTTVSARGLLFTGDHPWARNLGERVRLGHALHLDRDDLRVARGLPALITPGTVVAVCENPLVLEYAARAGARCPLVCVGGQFSTLALDWLRLLAESGARLRYHGDFDWAGLHIATRVLRLPGARPWRMSAADHAAALAGLDPDRLPPLGPGGAACPWDPALPEVMRAAGVVVEEECPPVRAALVADLTAWGRERSPHGRPGAG
ncbi:DUF2399 domain-containing protein [Marinactinospora thermotolerans]|uniref:DUF2399 domain-containing protein n=1 Tax=Marinactinospora thermotolerans TaxID=531310 RepID=UPI0013562E56|nr:DUF2399 domain-containing protein [Marinactinospora thermotolerans]